MVMASPVTIVVLVVTALASWIAFQRPDLKERWMFTPQAVLGDKQYDRLLTSGLIHADWIHFAFNAFSFYSFGQSIEIVYGGTTLLLVYVSSILGGSLLSLFIHRRHNYRALGASGGVCGVIFAAIFLLPGSSITMFPLPIGIPAYLYAGLFLVGSFLAHRRQADNIGHDAHLGGAIIGLLIAAALFPRMFLAAPWMLAGVLGLSLIVLLLLILDPLHLLEFRLEGRDSTADGERSRRYSENRQRNQKIAEIDRLLDKVNHGGLQSLSNSERRKLAQLSKELGGGSQGA
jgi:membrane associated rhomboid family serine protease